MGLPYLCEKEELRPEIGDDLCKRRGSKQSLRQVGEGEGGRLHRLTDREEVSKEYYGESG